MDEGYGLVRDAALRKSIQQPLEDNPCRPKDVVLKLYQAIAKAARDV